MAWLLVSALLYVFFVDNVIYFCHRALHADFFYRRANLEDVFLQVTKGAVQ